jgi:hypothetical protein
LPQAPQFDASLDTSTHAPAQLNRPAAHPLVHAPDTHDEPAGHAVPHAPQWAGSDEGSTHSLPQSVRGALQVQWHAPETQVDPEPQALPHEPQFALSVLVSTHAPPQDVRPEGHTEASLASAMPASVGGERHVPPKHTEPLGHAVMHEPQCDESLARLVQKHAPHGPVHTVSPAAHSHPHVPKLQMRPGRQVLPHAPQLLLSVRRSTHALPHNVVPPEHAPASDGGPLSCTGHPESTPPSGKVHVPLTQASPLAQT